MDKKTRKRRRGTGYRSSDSVNNHKEEDIPTSGTLRIGVLLLVGCFNKTLSQTLHVSFAFHFRSIASLSSGLATFIEFLWHTFSRESTTTYGHGDLCVIPPSPVQCFLTDSPGNRLSRLSPMLPSDPHILRRSSPPFLHTTKAPQTSVSTWVAAMAPSRAHYLPHSKQSLGPIPLRS